MSSKRWWYAVWLVSIGCFAVLHALNLRADFPNHTPWLHDWAKYTDEGWYGNAAIRTHLFGNWYVAGDFNPAPAVPVWPLLEWLVFCFTGVTIESARALAVSFFFLNLLLSYLLLRPRTPRWATLLALTLLVTNPFLYCFSRLAILEPMLIALALSALNLAVRLPKMRRPVLGAVAIGVLYTLMMLTKTTAVFLLPALGWAILLPFAKRWKLGLRCAAVAAATFAIAFGAWMLMVVHLGLLADYRYFFYINKYVKPVEFYWPLLSFWWSFHGGLWADRILVPLAGLLALGAVAAGVCFARRAEWAGKLILDPVFGASVWMVAGYIGFMTYQNHPQPRYFAVVAVFCFLIVAQGTAALVEAGRAQGRVWMERAGWATIALAAIAVSVNSLWTLNYAAHPQYTFVDAADKLTRYIDEHPNGKRLLVSISGDQITLATHLPSLCDDFGTEELVSKIADYQPGWYATWNDFDPGTLEDIHVHFSLEQVASFRAFDDPERNVLVLFKLHPLPNGQVREPGMENLQVPLRDDKIDIPIQ